MFFIQKETLAFFIKLVTLLNISLMFLRFHSDSRFGRIKFHIVSVLIKYSAMSSAGTGNTISCHILYRCRPLFFKHWARSQTWLPKLKEMSAKFSCKQQRIPYYLLLCTSFCQKKRFIEDLWIALPYKAKTQLHLVKI